MDTATSSIINKKPSDLKDTRVYFDNAATTRLDPEVLEAMMPYLTDHFGNPSSIYSYGRECRLAIENARKTVAKLLGARPGEIFFTSGGTESNNTAIAASIRDLQCRHIISSPIEHHAVEHTLGFLTKSGNVELHYVELDSRFQKIYNTWEESHYFEIKRKRSKRKLILD